MKGSVPLFWKILVAVLTVLCVGLLVAVVVMSVKYVNLKESTKKAEAVGTCKDGELNAGEPPKSNGLFTDLTAKELTRVRDYMLKQPSLELKPAVNASVDNNYIYMIQVNLPDKEDVLRYLEDGEPKPNRKASVVVFHGSSEPPVVKEYIVTGPFNDSQLMTHKKTGDDINFHLRPYDQIQHNAIKAIVEKETSKAYRIFIESYDGYCYNNCSNKSLTFIPQAPFGGKDSTKRTTWLKFVRKVEGDTLHPVNFEILFDFSTADISKWKVDEVYYNGLPFANMDTLVEQYDKGIIQKIEIPAPSGQKPLFSSYEKRGSPQPKKPLRAPTFYEPDGKRFTVSGRHVEYMSWSFDFRLDSISGLQLLDIKFNSKRIVYELSLQEAITFYSGYSPFLSTTKYVFSGWAMGRKNFELVRGVDCPGTAMFFDAVHYVDTAKPRSFKNAVCLFEMDAGVPLRRHYDDDHVGGYQFYGGLGSHVLVLRSISTIFDLDMIVDFVFYQNGAIESKVTTTGYLQAAYSTDKEKLYGFQVHDKIVGTIHEHLFNFKVDLDVDGRINSFEAIDISKIEVEDSSWLSERNQNVMKRDEKRTEMDAAFKFDGNQPSLFNMLSTSRNGFDVKKGYLIQPKKSGKLFSPGWFRTNMAPWSLYEVAITKQKPSEKKSSSIYNQANPIRVKFQEFLEDNDNIKDEDLVAWVSMGIMHVPRAEDIPNIMTPGNSVSFFLQPFNYFDFDPSMSSTNAVVIKPEDKEYSDIKVERYGTPTNAACIPKSFSLNFNGTY